MMRALWTGATGMISQQTNVDTISNNISNVNTQGYKKEQTGFKSLLYQNLQSTSTNSAGDKKPVAAQVGLGSRIASITSVYTQGSLLESGSYMDWAIEGDGFYKVQMTDGTVEYTRNTGFGFSLNPDESVTVCTSGGNPILDADNKPIVIGSQYISSTLEVSKDGKLSAKTEDGELHDLGIQVGLVQFSNAAGLEKDGESLLKATPASGTPMEESEFAVTQRSKVRQGYTEGSNVQIVDEMVNLIVAQRAYEMNSKTIQAADSMLQTANQLRG